MNAFGAYLSAQLAARVSQRRVVVFYDPRTEFAPFFDDEIEIVGSAGEGLANVLIGEQITLLARFDGTFLGLRDAIEPVVRKDEPEPLIVYLPGVERDRDGSVLMELEKGGSTYVPSLRSLARTVLLDSFTDAAIDTMLGPDAVAYKDIVAYLEQAESGPGPSILKAILGNLSSESLLLRWISSDEHDAAIVEKGALDEVRELIEARLGLSTADEDTISEIRTRAVRYVLVNEFRADLGDAEDVDAIAIVPAVPTNEQEARVVDLARSLRARHPETYTTLADRVEADLNLAGASVDAAKLGGTDTFRFEERALLNRAIELTVAEDFDSALAIVGERADSFWLDQDVARQAQWGACRLAAELGKETVRAGAELESGPRDAPAFVADYTADGGWFELDRIHRRLEAWVTSMSEEPACAQAVAVATHRHNELLKRMAESFSDALVASDWSVPGVLHQIAVFDQLVKPGGPTAYFFVDAMRFEMGVDLAEQLGEVEELVTHPAVAVLPTITPIGMAALLPGAAGSFSVVELNGKVAAAVDGTAVGGLPGRQELLKSRVPGSVDVALPDLLQLPADDVPPLIEGATLVIVRSQDIDKAGEVGESIARQVMDTTIANIGRAVRKLAAAGIEAFVVTADHGHQFATRKQDDMKIDAPGGDTVELHRRCWAGRGGATPPGTVRVSGAELGYTTDLDFIFPRGLGVFKAGGGLAYHHGGTSLQELIVPAVVFRIPARVENADAQGVVKILDAPEELTNRTFGVRLVLTGDLLAIEPIELRVSLLSEGRQVGQAGMANGAEVDPASGIVTMEPGSEATVGVMLTAENCPTVRLMVMDPRTDAVLDQTDEMPVKLNI